MLFNKKKTKTVEAPYGKDMSFSSTEAFNRIRTNLRFCKTNNDKALTLVVTSPTPGDGKSYIAINTAFAIAKSGARVLLVDCDLRKPTIHKKLNLKPNGGFTDLLLGMAKYDDIKITNVLSGNLTILTAGKIPPNPSELLQTTRVKEMFEALSKAYDYIIIDMPPVESVTDVLSTSDFIDGVLMVVRNGVTKKSALMDTIRQLKLADIKILGFVYNDFDSENGYYYNKYYKKYYYYNNYSYKQ